MTGFLSRVLCRITGHTDTYTDEYEHPDGHVQADTVCTRCGRIEAAWTGPDATVIKSIGGSPPPRKNAYVDMPVDPPTQQ